MGGNERPSPNEAYWQLQGKKREEHLNMLTNIIPSLQERLRGSSETGKSRAFFEAAIQLHQQLHEQRADVLPKNAADLEALQGNLDKVNQLLTTMNNQKRRAAHDPAQQRPSQMQRLDSSGAQPDTAASDRSVKIDMRTELASELARLTHTLGRGCHVVIAGDIVVDERVAAVHYLTKAADLVGGASTPLCPRTVTSERWHMTRSPPPAGWREDWFDLLLSGRDYSGAINGTSADGGGTTEYAPIWSSLGSALQTEVRTLCDAHGWEIWSSLEDISRASSHVLSHRDWTHLALWPNGCRANGVPALYVAVPTGYPDPLCGAALRFQLQSHAPSRPDGTPQQVFIFKPEGVQQARVDRTVAILVDDSLQAAVEELQEAAHSAPQPPSLSLLCIAWSTILGRFG